MIFITFSILDYGFQGVMGVMDFYGMLTVKHSSLFPESLPDEQNYFSLIMSGVCVGFLLLVIPIWIVQVKNLDQRKTAAKERKSADC